MAFPHAKLRRPIRVASAVRLYRQTTAQIRAGDDATLYRSLSGTHAGDIRTHELPRGDRRSGTGVVHSDARISPRDFKLKIIVNEN